jgi:hypothetical protein
VPALFTRTAGYSFLLTVIATSGGQSAQRQVTVVCVGGNSPPVFAPQSRSLPETAASGTLVGAKLTASDYENDTLTFSVSSVTPATAFR